MNRWDEAEYRRQMSAVRLAVSAFNEWVQKDLGRTKVDQLVAEHGEWSCLPEAIQAYKDATVRLNNLYKTMKNYMEDYEDMLQRGQGKMENVQGTSSAYGTFGSIFAGITAVTISQLEKSRAYNFSKSGKTFTGDYNDLTAFMNSKTMQNIMEQVAASESDEFGVYFGTIKSAITGETNPYVDKLMFDSLVNMVETIPGTEPVSLSNMDWEAIGEKLNMPYLADYMGPIDAILKECDEGGQLSKEGIGKLGNKLEALMDHIKSTDGKSNPVYKMLEKFTSKLEVIELAAGVGEIGTNALFNYINTYADQIAYLDAMTDAMRQAGYSMDTPLVAQIGELKAQYGDYLYKTYVESWDTVGDITEMGAKAIISEIPVLNRVQGFYSIASGYAELGYGDEIDAAQALMGAWQYDQVLTQSYEKYAALVESGVASEEEIRQADKLFEMVHNLKKKEYEAMNAIAKRERDAWINDGDGEYAQWASLSERKLKELKEFDIKK